MFLHTSVRGALVGMVVTTGIGEAFSKGHVVGSTRGVTRSRVSPMYEYEYSMRNSELVDIGL